MSLAANGRVTRRQPALQDRDNTSKGVLIPDEVVWRHLYTMKPVLLDGLEEGPASYQLDGGVTAYHGDDG